ncbi:MAG: extensin family protein, partial [Hyphomicrobium sp.]
MAEALYSWMKSDVQPLARKHLSADVIKIEVMSAYSCRNAYGRAGGRLSEHGLANALDIRGFITSAGK